VSAGQAPQAPMAGTVCMVTGASSGIGRAVARGLAERGARVLLVARDRARGDAAAADIRAAAGGDAPVEVELADLAVQAAVRDLAARVAARLDRLDVLVNNAGTQFGRRELTVDGVERTFALNHLGYFLLTILLLDLLKASAPARVVNVASDAHLHASIDPDDPQGLRDWSSSRAYGRSKLANVLFTYELARRLEGSGVTVNCAHPGVVATGFGREAGPLLRLGTRLARPFLLTPEQGADTIVWLASAPELAGATGGYYAQRQQRRSGPASYDRDAARRLWQASQELTGQPGG
jgi:retinol dehydrogenase 14